ncbi:uncharacterized protein LOC100902379 [Galendromus occidentalis]|uniref:Uncharacterized protein LOC100902379 n=1 Tax=Galendromus occidentalis TaxID=34638 RepID=A0AAJ6QYK0_9ACAR|nr:uncharacterized protein LOC100902379 [Galendromus occidentalis]
MGNGSLDVCSCLGPTIDDADAVLTLVAGAVSATYSFVYGSLPRSTSLKLESGRVFLAVRETGTCHSAATEHSVSSFLEAVRIRYNTCSQARNSCEIHVNCLKMRWNVFFSTFLCWLSTVISDEVRLELETNGPVYYKAPLAISGRLEGAYDREYEWIFYSRLPSGNFERILYRRKSAMINETFDLSETQAGQFDMSVRVTYTPFLSPRTIAYGEIKFELTNKIPVFVDFLQNGTKLTPQDGALRVSSADIVNATTRINDPTGYFQRDGTQITTQWAVNNGLRLKNASFAQWYPTAPDRIQDTLEMFMTAVDSNNTVTDGSVSTVIEARDPILNLNLEDKLWFQRGNLTHLKFTCNASTPIYYCFKYASKTTNISEFNCTDDDYIRRDVCQFSLTHYFGRVGDHEVMIKVRNAVNDILHWDPLKSIYIVHVYDVPTKGLLRLFIVPISCVILGTIVAVSGYALYEHTKGDMRVEVANFDFAGNSTREELDASLVERTFWTHLRDELAESSPIFHWLTRKPPQPPVDRVNDSKEGDDEPICPEP